MSDLTTHWHAEISGFVLRGYHCEDGYERRLAYIAVASAKCMGGDDVFIEGFLRLDGQSLSVSDIRGIARLLRDKHGVKTIHAKRKGRPHQYDTARVR